MFKKKEIFKVKSIIVDPSVMRNLTTADEYLKRGMAYYARKQYENAEKDLRTAISLNEELIDAYYSLGMVLKAAFRKDEAVQAFEKVLDLLNSGLVKNSDQLAMLRRLAKGHVNEIKTGDWNLEKEIWQRVQ
jgi:tetratricopeptide (TPR) repeat protein